MLDRVMYLCGMDMIIGIVVFCVMLGLAYMGIRAGILCALGSRSNGSPHKSEVPKCTLEELSEYGRDNPFPIGPEIPGGTAKKARDRAYRDKVYSGGIAIADEDIVPCEVVYKNIAADVASPLDWWVCDRKDLPEPSPAEAMIIRELDKYRCKWYREVSFKGLQVNSYSYPRYDILIIVPSTSIGIHIVEYDGKVWHERPESRAMDKLKNKFCSAHDIPITRYNSKDYYHIPARIEELMYHLHIAKK